MFTLYALNTKNIVAGASASIETDFDMGPIYALVRLSGDPESRAAAVEEIRRKVAHFHASKSATGWSCKLV